MIITFLIGFAVGMIVAMRYAPKLKVVNGKITLEWSDKKNPNNTNP